MQTITDINERDIIRIQERGTIHNINRYEIRKCALCGESVYAWTSAIIENGFEYKLCCRWCYHQYEPSEWFKLDLI